MLFGKDFIEYNKFMVQGLFVFIKARVQDRFNQPGSLELKVSKIELLEQVKENAFNNIRLKVKLENVNEALINKLENLINTKTGKSSIEFFVEDEAEKMSVKLFSKKSKVAIDTDFLFELDKITGIEYDLV